MFCKYCGANLPDGARFCSSCGATASASEERVEPTKAKMPENVKAQKGDYSYNKGEDYYSTENTIMNHESYESDIYTKDNRYNYVQKEVKYAENFDFNNFNGQANVTAVNSVTGVDVTNKPLGVGVKIAVTLVSLLFGCAVGYVIGYFVL